MSVDSESTHQNTSRMMHKNILSFWSTINYMVHWLYGSLTTWFIDCIYIITCKRCKIQYVGEADNIKNRMTTHISQIENNIDQDVALHFNKPDHDKTRDFSFQIFITNIINYRLRLEKDLIKILRTREPDGINENYPYQIKSLVNY
jgi:hypothetical protein